MLYPGNVTNASSARISYTGSNSMRLFLMMELYPGSATVWTRTLIYDPFYTEGMRVFETSSSIRTADFSKG